MSGMAESAHRESVPLVPPDTVEVESSPCGFFAQCLYADDVVGFAVALEDGSADSAALPDPPMPPGRQVPCWGRQGLAARGLRALGSFEGFAGAFLPCP